MKKILSIDGGGIRGVIPARILVELEKKMDGGGLAERFDLLAGTSTGSIIAAGLCVPENEGSGKPKYTAEDIVKLYTERGQEMFTRSFWKGVSSAWGISDEKYPHEPIESIFKEKFSEVTLGQSIKDVLITSYDLHSRDLKIFKTWKKSDRKIKMWHAVRASTAAPTYFEPTLLDDNGEERALVDGGVFANNPGMCAFAEAKRRWPHEPVLMVSLGTGHNTRKIKYEDAKNWGKLEWAVPVLGVILDGVEDAVHYQLSHLIPKESYFRFNKRLETAMDDMDNASQSNIRALVYEAELIIEHQEDALNTLASLLKGESD